MSGKWEFFDSDVTESGEKDPLEPVGRGLRRKGVAMSDCQKTSYTAFIALHLLDSPLPAPQDLEEATRHLKACVTCRATVPPETRSRLTGPIAPSRAGARQSQQLQRSP